MALKTLVKVGSITNLSDARYCAGMGVEMIGFNLDKDSPNFVNSTLFNSITGWITGVKLVGELREASANLVKEILQEYSLDYLQVNQCIDWEALHALGVPLICHITWDPQSDKNLFNEIYAPILPFVNWFLLESESDTLSSNDLRTLQQIASCYPVLLGFGVSQDNVTEILAGTPVTGIALKGSHEISPGFKDYDELADILEQLEEEEE